MISMNVYSNNTNSSILLYYLLTFYFIIIFVPFGVIIRVFILFLLCNISNT